MPSGSFEFTQSFGCVAQIGGWYPAVSGCPADAPAFHSGVDLAAPQGTRFYAVASGWVLEAGLDRQVGLANTRILIQHDASNDGYASEYLHWSVTYVRPGDYVRAGQPIGEVGSVGYSTGPHLHFSVVGFESGDRIDPISWLPRTSAGGIYAGLAPGSREIRIDGGNENVPDYADPAPAPVPSRQRLPDAPAASGDAAESSTRAQAVPADTGRQGVNDVAAAPVDDGAPPDPVDGGPAETTDEVPVEGQADDGGRPNEGRNDGGRNDGRDDGGSGGGEVREEPGPVEKAPADAPAAYVPPVPEVPSFAADPAPVVDEGRQDEGNRGGRDTNGGRDEGGGDERRQPKG